MSEPKFHRRSFHIHDWWSCPKCGESFCAKCIGPRCSKGHKYFEDAYYQRKKQL
jgi:threonine synthase